jgi:hypothetical protein
MDSSRLLIVKADRVSSLCLLLCAVSLTWLVCFFVPLCGTRLDDFLSARRFLNFDLVIWKSLLEKISWYIHYCVV